MRLTVLGKASTSPVRAGVALILATSLHQQPSSGAILPDGFVDEHVVTLQEAVGLTFGRDGRVWVWERAGKIWTIENGVKSSTPILDISDEVASYGDFGLLGFALHPNFEANGHIYLLYVVDRHHLLHYGTTNYNVSSNSNSQATIGRLTRYTAQDGFRSVDSGSRKILIGETATNGFPMLHAAHGIGTLLFGTDGTLLVSCGDAASFGDVDIGQPWMSYALQALEDGIIRPKENVGAYRSQLVDCLNGKILRIDPDTGDGVPSNPFYDSSAPKSPRSRVWALGLRNPYRMTLRPGTGSHLPAEANPGVIYAGDVGWNTWEEVVVCHAPGMNFGWPIYEGLTENTNYSAMYVDNQDAPNPLFDVAGCTQRYFYFCDLLKQDTSTTPVWSNPCATNVHVPVGVPTFLHTRPVLEWDHKAPVARTGVYSNGHAAVVEIGASNSPVTGRGFSGASVIGGAWSTNAAVPEQFRNTYLVADYIGQWIKCISFDEANRPTAVRDFADNTGMVVSMQVDPASGHLYYLAWGSGLRRIRYAPFANQPPEAAATADRYFGQSPLVIQFSSAGSRDPEGLPLTYRWDFGDGSPMSSEANPAHSFFAPAGIPTAFIATLAVTDSAGLTATNTLLVSANNTPPHVTINSPTNGARYSMSNLTHFSCSATIADAEHTRDDLTCVWRTILHHNEHTHAEPPDTNCTTIATTSPIGCNTETYYYRVTLTVTDPAGLATTAEVLLFPDCQVNRSVPRLEVRILPSALAIHVDVDAGMLHVIEESADLRGWTAIGTNALSWTHFVSKSDPGRFYRARLFP